MFSKSSVRAVEPGSGSVAVIVRSKSSRASRAMEAMRRRHRSAVLADFVRCQTARIRSCRRMSFCGSIMGCRRGGGRLGAVSFAEASVAVDAARLAALRTEASAHALLAACLFRERVSHRRVCARTARGFDGVRVRAAQAEPTTIVSHRNHPAAAWGSGVDDRGAL